MTEPTRQPAANLNRLQQHRRRMTVVSLATVVGIGGAMALGGCAASEGGVPLEQMTSASAPVDHSVPAEPVTDRTDPADVMFQSSEPFARHASDVNVFGELDGLGPSPFDAGGASGFRQVTAVEEGYDADQTVSPDGKWVLFSSTRHTERPELYLQRVGGQAVTQLTSDPADDSFPRFSPDGTQIAFSSNRAGNWDLYLMDVDGKNVRQLTRSNAQEIHPSFSPDGTRLVYSALGSRSGQWELWTLNLQSGERRMIGFGLFPDWSPRADRDVIAFQRARQRGTRWFSAWTLNLVDGEARDLTEVAYSSNAAIVAPTWSPDGRKLAFGSIADPQTAEDAHGKASTHSATQDVWIANADGTERRKLTDSRGVNAMPAWGSDGRVYFISDRGGSESIWSAYAGGTAADGQARRPRLPQVDEVAAPPVEAQPAAHHVTVPPPHTEPAHVPSPFIAPETPVSPAIRAPANEPAAVPHAQPTPPAHVVLDEPIVLQPDEPKRAGHAEEPTGDPEDPIPAASPANKPAAAHGETPHAAEPEHPEHHAVEPQHEPAPAGGHGGGH